MKNNIFKFAMVLLVSVVAFSGCKKGEDDPGISFRSRSARFAGEWKLTSMDKTSTSTNSGISSSTHYTYDGAILTRTSTYDGTSYTLTNTYSESFNTEKDGTYDYTIIDDGETSLESGNWMWLDENDNMDIENKEAVILTATRTVEDGNSYVYSGKSNFNGDVWVLRRLANDEMVVLVEYSSTDSDGDTYTVNGILTYTQN